MSDDKEMKEVVRICGEGEVLIEGSSSFFFPTAVVRGFEKMVEGKSPLFVVEAVMRICGLCHSSQGTASCEAFEDALGIFPPGNGLLARETIGLLNRLQSHLFFNILIIQDILREEIRDNAMQITLDSIKIVNKMLQELGGAPTHPNRLVIGGISKSWSEKMVEINLKNLQDLKKLCTDLNSLELDENNWTDIALAAKDIEFDFDYLASHPFYGDKYSINVEDIELDFYDKVLNTDKGKLSTSLVAKYKGGFVEVGPRARLRTYRNFPDKSLIGLQIARMEELIYTINRIGKILEEIDPSRPFKTEGYILRRGKGVGVHEAPRGTLIHQVSLDDEGRVENYKIVVPTMFNIPLMEKTGSDFGIRLLDPCVPCATH